MCSRIVIPGAAVFGLCEGGSSVHTIAVQDSGELKSSWKPVGGRSSRT